jgi:hypothetical protein
MSSIGVIRHRVTNKEGDIMRRLIQAQLRKLQKPYDSKWRII